MALFNIGDEIHILTENNNMYHIKRHTVTNIIQGGYYEIFDGEKKDSVSIHSNNIFKNCNDAFKERDRRIKSKKQEALNNEILLKQTIHEKRKKEYLLNQSKNKVTYKTNYLPMQKKSKPSSNNPYTEEELKELAHRIHRKLLKQYSKITKVTKKQTYKPRNNFGLRNPNEKKFVEYKPARRRYNPRYDGDARIRPVSKEIESRVRVIKNSSGIVIGVEKY